LVWGKLTEEKTATEIAKELKKHRSSISRVLLDMEKFSFVKCLNPKDSSFRCYTKNRDYAKVKLSYGGNQNFFIN